ncbi:hypothetical protein EZS27_021703 [termite gut metagenome]|uniref:Metallo-beta-lactamase domain-containing protein n=1 Tax=termite gut metagenome TaxID=433724 RepID=A0A5J4R687_9ZZZZ
MIRIFHPIGQGAFYTEQQMISGRVYTVVYDCGSITLSEQLMRNLIDSFFQKGSTIDLLFISHFHADHINGIKSLLKRCKVKRVVIPLLKDDDKIVLKLDNAVRFKYDETQIIDDPENFFGENVKITKVQVVTEGNAEPPNINADELSDRINSGTKIMMPDNWFYIPYNYKQEERTMQFSNALSELYDMSIDDININDLGNKDLQKKLQAAYKKVNGCLNKTSMLVFAGTDPDIRLTSINQIPCNIPCGCLYTGDVSLKQRGFIEDLRTRLNKYFNSIGTIQIPHHGSEENWKLDVLNTHMQCAVISHGMHNKYKHPSSSVFKEVITKIPFNTFCVTENPNTTCIQYIDLGGASQSMLFGIRKTNKAPSDDEIKRILDLLNSHDVESINLGICLMFTFDYRLFLDKIPMERLIKSPDYCLISLLKSRLLPIQYESIGDWSNGRLYMVQKDGLWGFINKKSLKLVVDFKYNRVTSYVNDCYLVEKESICILMNEEGVEVETDVEQ